MLLFLLSPFNPVSFVVFLSFPWHGFGSAPWPRDGHVVGIVGVVGGGGWRQHKLARKMHQKEKQRIEEIHNKAMKQVGNQSTNQPINWINQSLGSTNRSTDQLDKPTDQPINWINLSMNQANRQSIDQSMNPISTVNSPGNP